MEALTAWDDVPTHFQIAIRIVFGNQLKTDRDTIRRIFDLAKPKVVVNEEGDYWRINPEDGILLKKLIQEYA